MKTKKSNQPILCGTDFSTTAIEAADVAAAIAKKLHTKLILVHVDDFRGLGGVVPLLYDPNQPRAELKRHADRLRKSKAIVEERLVSGGSPFDRIVETVVRYKPQLVVVGAVGHGLAERLLIGSVAERVAETSPVPTLVVRPGSHLLKWVGGERLLEILVGYDFSSTADAALRWIADLRQLGRFHVTVAHVHAPRDSHRDERDLIKRAAEILPARQFDSLLIPCWGNCQGALFERAAREKVDLVVVGTHQRRGIDRFRLGSVSRGLLRHETRSVAVVPADQSRRTPAVLRFRKNNNDHPRKRQTHRRASMRGPDNFELKGDRSYKSG